MKRDQERLFSGGLGPELDFLRQLWALDHALQLRSTTMAQKIGVTSPQRLVLRLVGRFPGVLAGSLARLLHLDPSTVAGIVSRLEKRGLVGRQTDRVDRRRRRLFITPQGTQLLSLPEETIERATTRTLRSLSAGTRHLRSGSWRNSRLNCSGLRTSAENVDETARPDTMRGPRPRPRVPPSARRACPLRPGPS